MLTITIVYMYFLQESLLEDSCFFYTFITIFLNLRDRLMKKILFLSLLAWVLVGSADAKKKTAKPVADRIETAATAADTATSLAWKTAPVEAEDLRELLELKDLYLYKYDLSKVRDTSLWVICQIDEYFGRDSMRTVRLITLGNVYDEWRTTEPNYLTDLKFQFVPQTDSTMILYCDLEGRMTTGMPLKLRKAKPNYKFYASYQPKLFKTEELKVNQTVPVLLFGSSWYDEKLSKYYGGMPAYRFCMENELEADMSSRAFDEMPHYWVIRVGLQEK